MSSHWCANIGALGCQLEYLTPLRAPRVSACYSSFVDSLGMCRLAALSVTDVQLLYAISFFGLFGIYFSLQFLSLSDATVLTFLSPLCTAAAGALFLSEKFTRKEALAGRTWTTETQRLGLLLTPVLVLSLFGVVLIARPPFIFGSSSGDAPEVPSTSDTPDVPTREVTPEQRLIAVGYVSLR